MNYLFKIAASVVICLIPFSALSQTALNLIQGTGHKVTLKRDAASVYVANPSVADVQVGSSRTFYVSAIAPGQTTVIATDFEGDTLMELDVNVGADNTTAARTLNPGRSTGLALKTEDNVTVIRGSTGAVSAAQSLENVEELLRNQGRVVVDQSTFNGANQVSLRVRFVEASRDDLRNVGLDLSALDNIGSSTFRIGTGIFDSTAAQSIPSIGVRGVRGDTTLDGLLRALESRDIVQILSEPTLTTVSGRRATFVAGGELGFPVAQADGVVTTEFKQFGVRLEFLPVLLPNGRISLNVKPEVSFIDPSTSVTTNDLSIPALSVRRADTTVEVGSGQTFAIAGLYQQYSQRGQSGVPGLSAILGNRTQRKEEKELIIFVTSYLTKPEDVATRQKNPQDVARTVGFIAK